MRKLLALMVMMLVFFSLAGYLLELPFSMISSICIASCMLLAISFRYFRKVWFYRDPGRIAPKEKYIVVSPADGRIMYIKQIKNSRVISNKKGEDIEISELSRKENVRIEEGWLIGIYMTPFDVHYNYAPLGGVIQDISYVKTNLNLPMVDLWEYINFTVLRRAVNLFSRRFHFVNERMTFSIKGPLFTVHAILIADKFVNKIKRLVEEGACVNIGQKIAFIGRGSQVDLVISKRDITIETKVGRQVYGGKTVVAKY